MGETYGFNFRHYGGFYKTCKDTYNSEGFDQLENVLYLIKNDPNSRRIIINLWNPATQNKAALPACLCMYQFYVEHDERVSCMMTQRSADVFLGLPFNIASTALLTHLIANQVGRKPGRLLIQVGDAHVYEEHYNACQQQITKQIMEMPTIQVLRKSENLHFNVEDVVLMNYNSHGRLKAPMKA